jgi:hypothetical protein
MENMRSMQTGICLRYRAGILAAGVLAWLLTGCARAVVETELNADGSFKRTIQLHGTEQEKDAPGLPAPKLEEVFALPGGGAWATKREVKDKTSVVYTAERTFPLGSAFEKDIVVKGKMEKAVLYNSVRVTQLAPGRFQYTERLKWVGPMPKELEKIDPEMLAAIQKALPAELATPENVQATGKMFLREFWQMVFGPGEPLFGLLITQPDLAAKRAQRRIGLSMNAVLEKQFGDKMTQEIRIKVIKTLLQGALAKTNAQTKPDPAKGPPTDDNPGGFVTLTYSVKMPGKIIETNGEVDMLTNEVTWGFYAQAAAVDDIVLTAVCDISR